MRWMMPNLRARSVLAAAVLTPALLPPTRLSLCADAQPSPLDIPFPASLSEMSALQLQLTGVSGFTGYTAGYALKRTFRVFVFTTGVIFMGLQTLAHNQLITIHWDKMEEKFHAAVDLDQDGKLKSKDLQEGSDKLQAYLAAGLPSGASFSAGFILGLRS